MKLTKKLLALLLVFVMVFSLASCFGGPEGEPTVQGGCTSHVDNDGDGKCDNEGCDAPVGGYVPTPVTPDAAAAYVNAIWAAVETAKTVTATLDMSNTEAESDTVDKDGNVIYEAYNNTMTAHFDLTLAMSENGLNIKVTGNAAMGEDTQNFEMYLVDGIRYSRTAYNGEWTEWYYEAMEMPEEVTGIISQFTALITELLPEDFEITADMIAEVKATFAEAVAALMKVNQDGSFGAMLDMKAVVGEVVTFLTSITETTTTEEIVNSILAYLDPEITIMAILDNMAEYADLTVGEIYAAINETLETEFGMGVEEIKDAILAEEAITSMLISNGVFDEETLASIKEMDIDAMIEEYKDVTVDQLLYMMLAAAPEGGEPEFMNPEYDKVQAIAKEFFGEGCTLIETACEAEYVQVIYADADGRGYVVYLLVMSRYGYPETETVLCIDADGVLQDVKKITWKPSDANPDYGYNPPADDVVDAFYAKLPGKTAEEFKAMFTGDDAELVTGVTSTSTKLVASIIEGYEYAAALKADGVGVPDEMKALAEELVGDGASLTKVFENYNDYVQAIYADENGKGYVVYLLVMSRYGYPETETLVYINAEGVLAGVKKVTWKPSDANPDYGYNPPADDVVDAFYAKLPGKTAEEFKAMFTGDDAELVTGVTSTSTKLVASIIEAFEAVEKYENGMIMADGTLALIIEQAKAMLATPFLQLAGEEFAETVEMMKTLDLRALYSYINIKIGSDLSIEKIEIGEKLDFTVTTSTIQYVEGPAVDGSNWKEVECTVTITAKQEIIFTITSVSSAETTITAPEVEPEAAA